MLDLPARQDGFRVEVEQGEPPEVVATFLMAPLTDDQFMDLVEDPKIMALIEEASRKAKAESSADDPEPSIQDIPVRQLLKMFNTQVTGAEDVTIGGEPFDAENQGHLASISRGLKLSVATELITQQFTLGDMAGNSNAPDANLPEGTPPGTTPAESGA